LKPDKIFESLVDGNSIDNMYSKIECGIQRLSEVSDSDNDSFTLFLIRTQKNEIFGAFISANLLPH